MTSDTSPKIETAEPTRYLLPPAAYTSPAWMAAEQEQLFERTWTFVGVTHDLAEPGDFISAQVGRAPVVVVRGNDGEVRAFHNSCRHRGLPLVDDAGNCGRSMVCPYHRWNYGLDGQLRAVPHKEQFPSIDFDQLGLVPVRCETWKTLVFAHLDDRAEAEPLDRWLDGLDPLVENFHPEELVEISDQRHDVASNWKLYVENHVDWLHLWYLHADTLSYYTHAEGERLELGPHWASFEYLTPEAAAFNADPANTEEASAGLLPIDGLTEREASNGAHFIFPSLTLFTNWGYWMLGQVIPVTPTNFQLRLRVFAREGSDGARFEPVINRVMYEDYSATQAIQRAIASPAFSVGPLATSYEREIMRFHQQYLRHVTPPP